jgi:ubiquitin-protein ligase
VCVCGGRGGGGGAVDRLGQSTDLLNTHTSSQTYPPTPTPPQPRHTGAKGSPYEGGYYHGKLKFPPEYPLKPPSILMLTPSGRFKPNTRLCLSMSDFHPETWNPM